MHEVKHTQYTVIDLVTFNKRKRNFYTRLMEKILTMLPMKMDYLFIQVQLIELCECNPAAIICLTNYLVKFSSKLRKTFAWLRNE